MHNHLGSYECKLCLTLHNNEGNYLAHTQGKQHQTNLAKGAARKAKEAPAQPQPHKRKVTLRKLGFLMPTPILQILNNLRMVAYVTSTMLLDKAVTKILQVNLQDT
ncbi:unnamed protein product [Ilex paraguariensis]|uniref:Matrin-type domain-containing protein n=1 Tax=Ilex paraguariensis TaxID=185542 RepID=A0ABC8R7R1_9AQUA